MEARWWAMRPAQSHKPASYVCPFCDGMLHATSEHALIAPEGDVSKRRHAHMECVVAARKRGRLTTEDEWRAEQRRVGPEKEKRPPGGGRFGSARKRGRR
jgi:hypothetical protein